MERRDSRRTSARKEAGFYKKLLTNPDQKLRAMRSKSPTWQADQVFDVEVNIFFMFSSQVLSQVF